MRISPEGGVFALRNSGYEERAIPKAAGWRWHGGDCRSGCKACAARIGLKVWWTDDDQKVAGIVRQAKAAGATCEMPESVQQASAAVSERIEASRATDAVVDLPVPEGLAYLPYQRAGIAFAIETWRAGRGVLLGDDCGLGKTIQIIGLINADPTIRSVLIICPATIRLNWKRELERWLTRPMSVVVADCAPPEAAEIVVINYEKVAGSRANAKRMREVLVMTLPAKAGSFLGHDA